MKILVSDYDKTFYTDEYQVKENIKAVKDFMKENVFIIATGRSYRDFNEVKELYNLKYNYLIINHGATILKDENIIYNCSIDNEIKNKILNDLDLDKAIYTFACSLKESRIPLDKDNLTKIHVNYGNIALARKIKKYIDENYNQYVNVFLIDEHKAIEIVSANVSKASAIDKILKIDKIDFSNIYTIGDNYNDLEMVKKYKGCAIVNSVDIIKQSAIKEYNSVADLIEELLER